MLSSKKIMTTVVGVGIAAAGIATAAPAMAAPFGTATYDVTGSTFIGNQVNSTLPLGPSKLTATIDLDNGAVSNGTLPLPPKVLTFPVFAGAAKLTATVNFIQSGKITGQLGADDAGNGTAAATARYTIKLTNASAKVGIFPSFPLVIGNNCQTASPVVLNVKNPAGTNFDASTGGTLTGKYTIGQFTGCNILLIPGLGSLVVNALVPGSNNTVSITLRNGNIVLNP